MDEELQTAPVYSFGLPSSTIQDYTEGGCWFLAGELGKLLGGKYRAVMIGQETYHVGAMLPNGFIVDVEGVWEDWLWENRWWHASETNYPSVTDADEDALRQIATEVPPWYPDAPVVAERIMEMLVKLDLVVRKEAA